MTTRDNQISLLSQQCEALDKQLTEKVEALEKMQESHQHKLDQQYEAHNAERKELTDKHEAATGKIAHLERVKITLENQIESQKNSLGQKEKQLNELKEEFDGGRTQLTVKYNELKERYDAKEDELNGKNITFEKE